MTSLARRAYRGDVTQKDLQTLIDFYARGRQETGSFEGGVEMAPSRWMTDGSLEAGVDLGPLWDCDCAGADGPQVPDR